MKKASEVYRLAAQGKERIENGFYVGCCHSIGFAVDDFRAPDLCKKMKELYAPSSRATWWMGKCNTANHEVRILALCFMAAIAESEGD